RPSFTTTQPTAGLTPVCPAVSAAIRRASRMYVSSFSLSFNRSMIPDRPHPAPTSVPKNKTRRTDDPPGHVCTRLPCGEQRLASASGRWCPSTFSRMRAENRHRNVKKSTKRPPAAEIRPDPAETTTARPPRGQAVPRGWRDDSVADAAKPHLRPLLPSRLSLSVPDSHRIHRLFAADLRRERRVAD